jgi:hypothetical protein
MVHHKKKHRRLPAYSNTSNTREGHLPQFNAAVHIHTDNTHNATSGSSVSPNGLGAEHNARMFCGKMRRSAAARQRSSKLDWHDLDGDFLVHSSQNKLRNQLAVLTECARRRGGEAATRARRHRRVRCSPSSMAWRLSNPAQVYGMAPRTGGRKA